MVFCCVVFVLYVSVVSWNCWVFFFPLSLTKAMVKRVGDMRTSRGVPMFVTNHPPMFSLILTTIFYQDLDEMGIIKIKNLSPVFEYVMSVYSANGF